MGTEATAQAQQVEPERKFPTSIRVLRALILEKHGGRVVPALQELFNIGMDPEQDGRVRVSALMGFVQQVAGQPTVPKEKDEDLGNEGELVGRVVDGILKRPDGRQLVAEKLKVLDGGVK